MTSMILCIQNSDFLVLISNLILIPDMFIYLLVFISYRHVDVLIMNMILNLILILILIAIMFVCDHTNRFKSEAFWVWF